MLLKLKAVCPLLSISKVKEQSYKLSLDHHMTVKKLTQDYIPFEAQIEIRDLCAVVAHE